METQSTIKRLFNDDEIQFEIPPYQRAYSWRKKEQVTQFIVDIKEQNGNKNYYLGHFLFGKHESNPDKHLVIDGQQRITTIIIFFSCLYRILKERVENGEKIVDAYGEPIDLKRIQETYLQVHKQRKFYTVEYDDNYFENLIINGNSTDSADTESKTRIKEAWDHFNEVMGKESSKTLLNWKRIIENAVITTFEVADKVQATQIFAFQNDRGKRLSQLEILKAFLMYQLYLYCPDSSSVGAIRYIENEFADIYRLSERIKLEDDQVLGHHNTAFLKGSGTPLENVKRELSEVEDKEMWIKDFCTALKCTFINVERIEREANIYPFLGDVLILDAYNSWPLLLKIYHYHYHDAGNTKEVNQREEICRLMEITLFKLNFGDYRTNSLPTFARNYAGNIDELKENLLEAAKNGFQWYWNFTGNFVNHLKGRYHYNSNMKYLLWKWENYLRSQNKMQPLSRSDYLNDIHPRNLDNTIEHISPVNPNYTQYTDEFKNNYLNNLGNLVLMPSGRNSQLGNNNPLDKADRYQDSILLSQKGVGDVIKAKGRWGEEEIEKRHEEIVDFAIRYWSI